MEWMNFLLVPCREWHLHKRWLHCSCRSIFLHKWKLWIHEKCRFSRTKGFFVSYSCNELFKAVQMLWAWTQMQRISKSHLLSVVVYQVGSFLLVFTSVWGMHEQKRLIIIYSKTEPSLNGHYESFTFKSMVSNRLINQTYVSTWDAKISTRKRWKHVQTKSSRETKTASLTRSRPNA